MIIDTILSFTGLSKTKLILIALVALIAFGTGSFICINRSIESSKSEYEKAEKPGFSKAKEYDNLKVK